MKDIPFLYGELNKKVSPIEYSFVSRETVADFPPKGCANKLYVSIKGKTIYFWDETTSTYEPVKNEESAVLSVNGKIGNVDLTCKDVGALPADTPIPSTTKQLVNDSEFVDKTFVVGNFDEKGTANKNIFSHNVDTESHNDIRMRVESLYKQLTNFLNVNDESVDQLSEVLSLIDDNKDIINEITVNKINASDIQDNLITPVGNVPLSANQGVVLAQMIKACREYIDSELVKYVKTADVFNSIYPVGSIYISFVDVSPSAIFGGVWERIKDRFLLASGDIYTPLSTGGAASHTLTVKEMPSHSHLIGTTPNETGHYVNQWNAVGVKSQTEPSPVKYYGAGTSFTGEGVAHNNMPPYSAVYIWKRVE